MLFIDEYDVPIQEAYLRGYYDEMIVIIGKEEVIYNPWSVLNYIDNNKAVMI